jgi:hypothetical protein
MHLIRRRRIVSLLKILIRQNLRRTAPFRQSRQSPAPVKRATADRPALVELNNYDKNSDGFFCEKRGNFFSCKTCVLNGNANNMKIISV